MAKTVRLDGARRVARRDELVVAVQPTLPKYTELACVGHDWWTPVDTDPAGLVPWMFAQRKA